MTTFYSITDIENIKFSGFQYTLPKTLLDLVKKIEGEIQIQDTTEKKTNDFDDKKYNQYKNMKRTEHKHNRHNNNNNIYNRQPEIINEDWESIRNFKSTKIETKEGIEKSINNIRILLNKISIKNYETQKKVILDSIQEFFKNNEIIETTDDTEIIDSALPSELSPCLKNKKEDIEKLTQAIFDIVSTNKFFSEIYANLYNEMIGQFPIFKEILIQYIKIYKSSIEHIYFIDPNKDYDGYCLYTKKNDNRKAMTLFIVNMCKNHILENIIITDLLQYFLDKSLEYIDLENRTNELEEITENLFIVTSNVYTLMVNNEDWIFNLLPCIINISQMKIKEHKSLSNRVIFKYMDIIDSMEN